MGLGTQETLGVNSNLLERIKMVLRENITSYDIDCLREETLDKTANLIMAEIPENPQERELALAMFLNPAKACSEEKKEPYEFATNSYEEINGTRE